MDDSLKHQIIKTIEYTYIAELCNKYTGFMGFKTINLVHHRMERYGKVIETDRKENQTIFYETLDTTMPIHKYFERIDN